MSTTVTIDPTADSAGVVPIAAAAAAASAVESALGAAFIGAAAATVAVGSSLVAALKDDAECRNMLEQARLEQRTERFAVIRLRTSDLGRLAQSAREAQFTVREARDWVRIDVPGQRDSVWAVRTPAGIAIAGGAESGARVSVANSVSRLTRTLASKGANVALVPSRDGRQHVEVVATTPDGKQLKIAVTPTGKATVDAVNHRGPECEQAVRDLAVAMEGSITHFCRKPEFFGGGVQIGNKQRA